jgi:hypothetical protein
VDDTVVAGRARSSTSGHSRFEKRPMIVPVGVRVGTEKSFTMTSPRGVLDDFSSKEVNSCQMKEEMPTIYRSPVPDGI